MPLEADVGTGERVFDGSIEQDEMWPASCIDLQTITSVHELKHWSLEELRLYNYEHGVQG